MNPSRVDFLVDLAYGVLIFIAIVLFMIIGTNVGVAFAVGVLLSYLLHVVWKMARFDPDWMTREVAETVAQTVDETVEETVDKEVSETVEQTVAETVDETVEQTVEKTVDETVEKTVAQTVDETVEKTVDQTVEKTVGKEVSEVIAKLEAINDRVDRRPRADEVEETIEAQTEEVEGKLEEKIDAQTEEIETKLSTEEAEK